MEAEVLVPSPSLSLFPFPVRLLAVALFSTGRKTTVGESRLAL